MKNVFWMAGTAMTLVLTATAFAAAPARATPAQQALPLHGMMQVAKNGNHGNHGNRGNSGDHQDRRDNHAGKHDNRDNHVGRHDNRVEKNDNGADREEAASIRNANAWKVRYPNGVAAYPSWSRGDALYSQYWQPQYQVNDWKGAGLPRPGRGSQWVHVNDNYMLVRTSNGVIRALRPAQ